MPDKPIRHGGVVNDLAKSRRRWITKTAPLAIAMLVAGCGSAAGSSPGTTAKAHSSTSPSPQTNETTKESNAPALLGPRKSPPPFPVASTARTSAGGIDRLYTCQGRDISPPVTWKHIPRATKELLVFVESLGHGPTTINWAVAGLKPSLSGLAAGTIPSGAIVGRNSFGKDAYSVCPAKNPTQSLISIVVVAVPRRLSLQPGFDPIALIKATVTSQAHTGSVLMTANPPKGS